MTKKERLKSKFMETPPPKDFTWNDLISVMGSYGYELKPGKGSHFAFYCAESGHYVRGIPKPHSGGNAVKQIYIKKIRQSLESEGLVL